VGRRVEGLCKLRRSGAAPRPARCRRRGGESCRPSQLVLLRRQGPGIAKSCTTLGSCLRRSTEWPPMGRKPTSRPGKASPWRQALVMLDLFCFRSNMDVRQISTRISACRLTRTSQARVNRYIAENARSRANPRFADPTKGLGIAVHANFPVGCRRILPSCRQGASHQTRTPLARQPGTGAWRDRALVRSRALRSLHGAQNPCWQSSFPASIRPAKPPGAPGGSGRACARVLLNRAFLADCFEVQGLMHGNA
jgi:hypothetical protein